MPFTINDMRANLEYGGMRPSHFNVIITNPYSPAADIKTPFMVRAASVPAFTIGRVNVPYFGRIIPIPGDRTWEDWTTTIINDEDFLIRDALERWSNAMNAFERNIATNGANPNNYKSTALVTRFGKAGNEVRVYQIDGIFPLNITAIENDWESTDTLETYQVTWAFDSCRVVGGTTGDAGGV